MALASLAKLGFREVGFISGVSNLGGCSMIITLDMLGFCFRFFFPLDKICFGWIEWSFAKIRQSCHLVEDWLLGLTKPIHQYNPYQGFWWTVQQHQRNGTLAILLFYHKLSYKLLQIFFFFFFSSERHKVDPSQIPPTPPQQLSGSSPTLSSQPLRHKLQGVAPVMIKSMP